jgi:GGDEF domain-containing protein
MLRSSTAFTEDLELELLRADRSGRPASIVVVGLGSDASCDEPGEERQRELAGLIRSAVRTVDVAYRIGVDEFALILPETRALDGLIAARRIRRALAGGGAAAATAGIAEAGPGIDRHLLFRHAYCALLAAGGDGRSAELVYSPELERSGPSRGPEGRGRLSPR